MDADDRQTQPGAPYYRLSQGPPEGSPPQEPKVEQQQQDNPQAQWHVSQPYNPYAFGFPPQSQPHPEQQQVVGNPPQPYAQYGNPPYAPYYPPMGYGGYPHNFPPQQLENSSRDQTSQGQFQQPPPAPAPDGPQVHPGALQHPQPGQHPQFQQIPYPGYPPHPQMQQFPHAWMPPGYYPNPLGGQMQPVNSHAGSSDPPHHGATAHPGQAGSPTPQVEQKMHHGGYPLPPSGKPAYPSPYPLVPTDNTANPVRPHVQDPVAQPAPAPAPQPVPPAPRSREPSYAPSRLSSVARTSANTKTAATAPAPAVTTRRAARARSAAQAAAIADSQQGGDDSTSKPADATAHIEGMTNAMSITETPAIEAAGSATKRTLLSPPPPYGPTATNPDFRCSQETQRLHHLTLERGGKKTNNINIHGVKHAHICVECSTKRKRGCDRLWPCVNCCRVNKKWGDCRYESTNEVPSDSEDKGDGGVSENCSPPAFHDARSGSNTPSAAGPTTMLTTTTTAATRHSTPAPGDSDSPAAVSSHLPRRYSPPLHLNLDFGPDGPISLGTYAAQRQQEEARIAQEKKQRQQQRK
ncbi:uncharacterized protein BKCO1_3000189 [Diplodia corticola]|uniref:Uncharacterized protein n=1 Tax=Diplodia corticola TaxID=236234 RepID=A0A1J9RFI5_9PEZI|nr:uncharacterized protein BKCO1_3000189 [Diplodia corticola]OJD38850.1 hypothetical protein BKCO1_3000189 [Diplodia corticola]